MNLVNYSRVVLKISIFSSAMATMAGLMAWALSAGFGHLAEEKIVLILGLAYFIFFLPTFKNYFSYFQHYALNDALIPLYALLFLLFFSFVGLSFWHLCSFIGYIFFIFFWTIFSKKYWRSAYYAYAFMFIFFNLWAINISWSFAAYPAYLPSLAVLNIEKIDILYHTSMAEMLKNYGVPSTGLDGIPFMYYHFGSHLLFAKLSQYLNISVLEAYFLAYPIIFIPLFFYIFLIFIIRLRLSWGISSATKYDFGFSFWFIFLAIFLQLFRHLYSGGLLGYNFLTSESLVISLILLFIIAYTVLVFWEQNKKIFDFHAYVFLLFFLPISISLVGFLKVSSMFILAGWVAFFFFRLQLYKYWQHWLGSIMSTLSFIFTYINVVETDILGTKSHGYEGKNDWFYFYFKTHELEYFNFFVLYYIWFYVFIAIFIWQNQLFKWSKIYFFLLKNKLLGIEWATFTIIWSIIPTTLLVLTGTNAMYFLCMQIFVSTALLLAYLPEFKLNYLQKISISVQKNTLILGTILAFLLMYINVRDIIYRAIKPVNDLKLALTKSDSIFLLKQKKWREQYALQGLVNDKVYQFIEYLILNPDLKTPLERNKNYQFIQKLVQLNEHIPQQEKSKTLFYLGHSQVLNGFALACHEKPFLVPTIAGIAQIKGLSLYCPAGAYGYEYYEQRLKGVIDVEKIYSETEILEKAKQKGFSKVIYWRD